MRAGGPGGEDDLSHNKEEDVERLAVIAQLKPGTASRAMELIEQGPPFSPAETGFERHTVFVSGEHVLFVFEGGKLDRVLRDLVDNPSNVGAFQEWQALLDGLPIIAREAYSWQRGEPWAEGWGE
jgi:hypothetical protein